ncbi:MAG: nitrous oxide-stimulated promoter family protein [Elusimicrobia bacterium]|nr:nitrous oxide-stimulated promoter family protein [Elusimicrobiota bacterium]
MTVARRVPFNIRLDKRTVSAMVRIFCRGTHGTGRDCCSDCGTLLDYAHARLDHCPFGPHKTTCAKCPVHCYRPHERDGMRRVMRVAGPRMFPRHPWLTLWHAWQSMRGKPKRP